VAAARHRAGPWRQAAAYLIASQDSARGRDQALGGPRRRNAQVHRRPGQGHDRLRHAGDLRRPVRANYRHKPDWHSGDIDKGEIKVIYTGDATDDAKIRKHVRRPSQNKVIQQRAKNPDDELELLIVQSMLLTGFDSPPLHTMYADKPMQGAALMPRF